MIICSNCGQHLDDAAVCCTVCGQNVQLIGTSAVPAVSSGEVSPEDSNTPVPAQAAPGVEQLMVRVRPLLAIVQRLVRTRKFWIYFGVGLLGVGLFSWLMSASCSRKPKGTVDENPLAVEVELQQQFTLLFEEVMKEKLEWARNILRQRIPSRFPEELVLEVDKDKTEVMFADLQKQRVIYSTLVAYHFLKDFKEEYTWHSVTIYFEWRNNAWVVNGEKWIREHELEVE